ncbi:MAG: glutamate--tRNA ligase [Elusimicrobia bacterium]|nr:glutamate--tRNA ligase [Elusimicrobiota bacterium]
MSTEKIRTRFAPSPTGYLHIGGVRTALYNYLFAKKNKGKFILRIEDTDLTRSDEKFTRPIMEGLKWLGLDWDEGPYYQSKRKDIYDFALKELIDSGEVYRCFCTPEELAQRREENRQKGGDTGYDGRCLRLTEDEQADLEKSGLPYAWRIKTPDSGFIKFEDLIKGEVSFPADTIHDFVILKSDGMPAYNFACVVDDSSMDITHVIRGDDHISNTPKQILIFDALKIKPPRFAHLPQVHGIDGKRLSKRTGAVSLAEYQEKGYLPAALRNYLALLGWSTEDSQQLFTEDELENKFDLSRVGKSAGVFDIEKLNWMNGKFIRDSSASDLANEARPWLEAAGIIEKGDDISDRIKKAIELEKEKFMLLSDIPSKIDILIKDSILYDTKAVTKRLKKEGVRDVLEGIIPILQKEQEFTKDGLEKAFRVFCEDKGIGAGKLFHPVRVAVSGRTTGPGVFELLEFLGKDRVLERIEVALKEYVE